MKSTVQLQALINDRLAKLALDGKPTNLYHPISYMLSLGAKRFRPLLVLLTAQMRGGTVADCVAPAMGIEVFHNFTLLHDDIMDAAPLRRGHPSVHEKWNSNIAILSGDAMFVRSYQLICQIHSDQLILALTRFNDTALEVCEGQQWDMDFEDLPAVSERDYLEMIRLKTAVLLGFSMELGAMMAGFNHVEQRQLYLVGESFGLGFQLMDDLLDVYGDQQKVGKQVGGDIIANKKTYLMIAAYDRADSRQLSILRKWMEAKDFDPAHKVASVKKIYDDLDIPQLVKTKMEDYFSEAFRLLKTVDCDPQALDIFLNFANELIQREK
ncbi:MAG: polyprenyl synthetase family protein [Flammeovirgaceae bacterium]|jgi:geranylgeranyl diphosphate synthase, type II|nr:polyprenyl synthetase family protein [Flammeovirgaceae bacterium]|tara:strand:- start:16489 stop:17463 length:975 start_codon:yes stop_codon:yes gene_type:complete